MTPIEVTVRAIVDLLVRGDYEAIASTGPAECPALDQRLEHMDVEQRRAVQLRCELRQP
jgi:hypothetical protein